MSAFLKETPVRWAVSTLAALVVLYLVWLFLADGIPALFTHLMNLVTKGQF